MSMRTFLTITASAGALTAMVAAAPAWADGKLEELKEQGFARVAIANEPPFTCLLYTSDAADEL